MSARGATEDPRFIGVLPAAGRGTRLAPLRYPKELLPMVYEPAAGAAGGVQVRAVAEYSLEAMAAAGVGRAVVVVAPWKLDVVTYFGDGACVGLDIGYVFQEEARGLPYAIDLARPWTRGGHVVFAMPDTIVTPRDALECLKRRYLDTGADLALAVFPTDEAHRLGPVVLDADGNVTQVVDKPERPPARNTWGAAVWGDRFAALLHEELDKTAPGHGEPVLGHYFDLAVRRGLRVVAQQFPDGSFEDAGTRSGLLRCLGGSRSDTLSPASTVSPSQEAACP